MLVSSLAQWWSWGLVTPLILWIDRRLPIGENRLASRILAHVPLSVVLTLVHFFLSAAIGTMLGTGIWRVLAEAHFLPRAALPGLLWSWLVYWMIFGGVPDFSIPATLPGERTAGGAHGAEAFRSAPEFAAHAVGSAFSCLMPSIRSRRRWNGTQGWRGI